MRRRIRLSTDVYLALGRRRKRYLGAYYMEDLDELSCIDICSLSRLIGNSK